MKLRSSIALILVAIMCFALIACDGGKKAVNAEAQYDNAKQKAISLAVDEYDISADDITIKSVDYVEITHDDLIASITGDVYYKFSFSYDNGKDLGTIYVYYCAEENAIFNCYGSKEYSEYLGRVKNESTEGVIGSIEL